MYYPGGALMAVAALAGAHRGARERKLAGSWRGTSSQYLQSPAAADALTQGGSLRGRAAKTGDPACRDPSTTAPAITASDADATMW